MGQLTPIRPMSTNDSTSINSHDIAVSTANKDALCEPNGFTVFTITPAKTQKRIDTLLSLFTHLQP
jgi:hypothetical protein